MSNTVTSVWIQSTVTDNQLESLKSLVTDLTDHQLDILDCYGGFKSGAEAIEVLSKIRRIGDQPIE